VALRDPEGIGMPPPGNSAQRRRSGGHDQHIRNVEAVGSNPITSTKAQVNGLEVDSRSRRMAVLSATPTLWR
jgi:hypothetical protein